MKNRKKGAIEMSMQTIIIVVIGITLLTLGLRFVYTTFSGITEQQEGISELTEKQISDLFGGSDEPLYLTKDRITVEQGAVETIKVNILNTNYDNGNFKYTIAIDDKPAQASNVESWFVWSKTGRTLKNGKGYVDTLVITVPDDARTGPYLISFNLDCPGEIDCGFEQLLIEVKGG